MAIETTMRADPKLLHLLVVGGLVATFVVLGAAAALVLHDFCGGRGRWSFQNFIVTSRERFS